MSSNPKTALGILTMAAPIVLLGTICTITTIWYTIPQEPGQHHAGGVVTPICQDTLYVQLLNGVCDRGKVDGIDVATSCIQWTDTAQWKQIDQNNLAQYQTGKKNYHRSDTADEVATVWIPVRSMCISTIPLSIVNFALCLVVADVQLEFWDLDFDKWTLAISGVANIYILLIFLISLIMTYDTDVLNKNTWRTDECGSTTAPSFAYFLTILGGVFCLISMYVAVYSFYLIYIRATPPDEVPLNGPGSFEKIKGAGNEPIEEGEEGEEEEEEDSVEGGGGGQQKNNSSNNSNQGTPQLSNQNRVPRGKKVSSMEIAMASPTPGGTDSRPHSANAVAPAPSSEDRYHRVAL